MNYSLVGLFVDGYFVINVYVSMHELLIFN